MTRFVYDGSFDGFLCAVSMALSASAQAAIAPIKDGVADLFFQDVPVASEDGPARALRAGIVAAAGEEEMETLLLAQASGDPEAPGLLLRYISLTLAAGAPLNARENLRASIRDNAALPEVLGVQRIRNRVSLEIHKFLGLVRLRKVGGCVYYARIEPDSNIVGFIGPHFADRFRDQSILVRDARRNTGFWRDAGTRSGGSLVDLSRMPPELERALDADPSLFPAPADESLVQSLWMRYFARIAIPERRNPALQARLMPRRYWKNLVEKKETAG